jgi:hypothetical protein
MPVRSKSSAETNPEGAELVDTPMAGARNGRGGWSGFGRSMDAGTVRMPRTSPESVVGPALGEAQFSLEKFDVTHSVPWERWASNTVWKD